MTVPTKAWLSSPDPNHLPNWPNSCPSGVNSPGVVRTGQRARPVYGVFELRRGSDRGDDPSGMVWSRSGRLLNLLD